MQEFKSVLIEQASKLQPILHPIVLILLSLAFLLSDWLYGLFTFSEYILVIVLAVLLLTLNFRISKKQLQIMIVFSLILLTHYVLQTLSNESFESRTALMGIAKLLFYSVVLCVLINYLGQQDRAYNFLTINNIAAILAIIVGLYITFELYRGSRIPQELFWRFTRRDIYSYYFESNPGIIRTRSIFSEPAHLGFYLNTLVAANLFSGFRSRLLTVCTLILSFGVLLTFSYSMILILIVTVAIKIFQMHRQKRLAWSNLYLLIPLSLMIVAALNWEVVQTTLIQRTIAVLTGQDTSARMRLFDSWQYVTRENILLGNGIGQTAVVTNNYAYALSDMGVTGMLLIVGATLWLFKQNWAMGIIFVLLNSAKGGYLSSGYWLMILFLTLYSIKTINRTQDIKERR